jgi:hypothetical protein
MARLTKPKVIGGQLGLFDGGSLKAQLARLADESAEREAAPPEPEPEPESRTARVIRAAMSNPEAKAARLANETAGRDAALELLNFHRGELIEAAFSVAVILAKANGTVTSTDVLRVLRREPEWALEIANKDPRFMGPVFRRKCWVQEGWASTGSHRRRVPKWRYAP